MASIKPRVKLPRSAAVGEVITVKTLISHPMESGQRKDSAGGADPRQIINKFVAMWEGETIFSADIEPAVSSNPYFEFTVKFPGEGKFRFEWTDDDGSVYELEKKVKAA